MKQDIANGPIIKYYAEQSIAGIFDYKEAHAGDRPEINEFKIRGDISNYYRLMKQEVDTVLNTYTDQANLVKGLLGIFKKKTSEVACTSEQLAQTFYLVITEIFEKACFESKFVELYAKVLIKIADEARLDLETLRKIDVAIKEYS